MTEPSDISTWDSFEAMDECIRRDTNKVAADLGMSPSMVGKWKEQPRTDEDFTKSGARNPLDRVLRIMDTIGKIDPERAHIPIKWLCAQNGLSTPFLLKRVNGVQDVHKALLKWTKEFGDACRKVSEVMEDGKVDSDEHKEVYKEMMELVSAGMSLLETLKDYK